MKSLIIANWKCNPVTLVEAGNLFNTIRRGIKGIKKAEVVVCPPFIFLESLVRLSSKTISLGAQDCFWENKGAFTGEVSPAMIKKIGVNYVILGHSERRKYFSETDEVVNKKIKKSLKEKLKPILCIGETIEEKKQGDKIKVIREELKRGLKGISQKEIKNIIIAYEPIWAIGTGENCSIEETMSSVLLIRKMISKIYSRQIAAKTRILYGGSVTSRNAGDYIKTIGVNGLLVGGASLKPNEFLNIVKSGQ